MDILREFGRSAAASAGLRLFSGDAQVNTGDPATLRAIIAACGLDADAVLKASEAPALADKREAYTKHAISQGVFGAPSFVIANEIFWGQDRLDFVDRKLAA
jgi:carboxymethylenebutenolidase